MSDNGIGGIMLKRLPSLFICLFIITNFSSQLNAGFKDFVKGAMKTIEGEKGLTNDEIIKGLKEALEVGTKNAVQTVSKTDGYFNNPLIKIPLPENVQKVEKLLRTTGFSDQVDEFVLSMNRAAERAAPEAKTIFWDAIKQMTFTDARGILEGQDNAATQYFKEKTSGRLQEVFKPITRQAMSEVGTTSKYQSLDAKIKTIPFANKVSFDLDQYVTDKALDGLFLMLAEEELKIRQNPTARTTDLLKKVFGSK